MGRNHVKKTDESRAGEAQAGDESDKPQMRGGALGVTPDRQVLKVGQVPGNVVGAAVHRDRVMKEPVPEVRQWRVKWAPPNGVMYDSMRVPMRPGKIVTDATYNLSVLTRQGVVLEEILPEKKAEALPEKKAEATDPDPELESSVAE